VAAIGRRVRGQVAFFSTRKTRSAFMSRHLGSGGRAYLVEDDDFVEVNGRRSTPIAPVTDVPIALGGLARHNVANVLAASGGARGLGASIEDLRHGLMDFKPSSERSPGRLNIFRLGSKVVIVDFAHNEAGVTAILDVAEGIAAGAAGRTAPITAIIGTAGDRPDDTLRGIGRIAGQRAQRVAIKETLRYLRGRSRESVVGEMKAGLRSAGVSGSDVPVYETETEALRAELSRNGSTGGRPDAGRVIVLMCHEEREEVFRALSNIGARPVEIASELTELVPRLQGRPRGA
jgi:cyanophycin synthetase